MFRIMKRAPWIALGGAAVWLFDPERGPERRAELRSWFDGTYATTSPAPNGESIAA